MGLAKRLIPAAFVLFLLFVAIEMEIAEGRSCESKSQRFKGTCLSETNCGNVCRTEGFPGGDCRGLRRRCFCTRPCP